MTPKESGTSDSEPGEPVRLKLVDFTCVIGPALMSPGFKRRKESIVRRILDSFEGSFDVSILFGRFGTIAEATRTYRVCKPNGPIIFVRNGELKWSSSSTW